MTEKNLQDLVNENKALKAENEALLDFVQDFASANASYLLISDWHDSARKIVRDLQAKPATEAPQVAKFKVGDMVRLKGGFVYDDYTEGEYETITEIKGDGKLTLNHWLSFDADELTPYGESEES